MTINTIILSILPLIFFQCMARVCIYIYIYILTNVLNGNNNFFRNLNLKATENFKKKLRLLFVDLKLMFNNSRDATEKNWKMLGISNIFRKQHGRQVSSHWVFKYIYIYMYCIRSSDGRLRCATKTCLAVGRLNGRRSTRIHLTRKSRRQAYVVYNENDKNSFFFRAADNGRRRTIIICSVIAS